MKIFMDVGSFDGSDSFHYYKQGYKVYAFEPKKDLYDNLYEKTKNLDNFFVYNKAVSLNDGITKFNICKEGGASSILEFRKEEELKNNWFDRTDIHYSGISYDVETTRLDTFIDQHNLQNTTIDYLHIDAQGVDLDVLKSLGKYINNVKQGVVETIKDYNKSIYVNQHDNIYDNVKVFLELNGFIITEVERNDDTNCEYNIYFQKIN